ncbi:putative orfan [Tupanvirus soda lake]|uniref:Orfan n=2 Tax=Tupanvirus TaxID=2094720 RepID=A0AC62AD82_9VIRU|nr:putative orfan [Tupanvirus soda lake]QKU35610.1 putative orfan [Tupanvirus soda lake]
MNATNDFIYTLINNRERIVDKLSQNYKYEYLHKIFSEINNEKDPTIKINPNNKILYRLLSGNYEASRYDKSSIDWIPSEELVDGIITLANHFDIKHIEEIYTGMGILSALLSKKQNKIQITAADTFDNISTCNKLDIFPIAKRGVSDYKYYHQLKQPYPDMVISTHFFENSLEPDLTFVNNVLDLINSCNHKTIILFLPNTCTLLYENFYYLITSGKYKVYTYHVKAFDKYYYLANLMTDYYKSSIMAHILVKNDIAVHDSYLIDSSLIDSIFSTAIIPVPIIDTHCIFYKWLVTLYKDVSPKLIKRIIDTFDIQKQLHNHTEIKNVIQNFISIKPYNIPEYIYDIDEFLFWSLCVIKNLYFVFENRCQFFCFYTTVQSIKNSEIRQNINFPAWVRTLDNMYKYIYLDIVKNNSEANQWKNNRSDFYTTFNTVNEQNKKLLLKLN